MTSVYEDHGYSSRDEYLGALADEYGVPLHVVRQLAELLGPDEDFDGLVTALQVVERPLACEDAATDF